MFYKKHIFVCTHLKEGPGKCCAEKGEQLFHELKSALKKADMHGEGKYRVSKSGCLGRCKMGPNVVIYPESRWYHDQDTKKILEELAESE